MNEWMHGCMDAWLHGCPGWKSESVGGVKDGQLSLVISHWEIGEDLPHDCLEVGFGVIAGVSMFTGEGTSPLP